MSLAKRGEIQRPVRQGEAISVPELCEKDVLVRQMTLTLYLKVAAAGYDPADLDPKAKRNGKHREVMPLAMILADCVVDADNEPVFDEDEWEAWGVSHFKAAMRLYDRINKLSGTDIEATEKN